MDEKELEVIAENFDRDIRRFYLRETITEVINIKSFAEIYFSENPRDFCLEKEINFLTNHIWAFYPDLFTEEGINWMKEKYPILF